MLEQWAAAGVKTVVTPCADCRHTFTRVYPDLEGARDDMPEILHTVELRRPAASRTGGSSSPRPCP